MTALNPHLHSDIVSPTAYYIPHTVSAAIVSQCHALGIPTPTAAEQNIWQTCHRTADRIVRLFNGRAGWHPSASEIAAITPAPTPNYADIIANNVGASNAWTLPPETGSDA